MSNRIIPAVLVLIILFSNVASLCAQGDPGRSTPSSEAAPDLDIRELVRAGGVVGYIIVAMSVAMVALIVEHLLSIRRNALMPPGLAEEVHRLIGDGRFQQAEQQCRMNPSFLGRVLAEGLSEVGLGYSSIEKSMEDAAREQAARLYRKIEYLSVIGTIAPMLGLMGTVWGMIVAFMEFQHKAAPQAADFAPGLSQALITTLLGLGVAVPALTSFAIFRNRIDELSAESTLLAEHVFSDYKRSLLSRPKGGRPPESRQRPRKPSDSPREAAPTGPAGET